MTKKFHILLIILTLGFFVTPTLTYACGTKTEKTEKSCCKKNKSNKATKKNCCKKNQSKSTNDCNGQCGDRNCVSYPTNYTLIPNFKIELTNNNVAFISHILNFRYNENYLSDGFASIWIPPNIA